MPISVTYKYHCFLNFLCNLCFYLNNINFFDEGSLSIIGPPMYSISTPWNRPLLGKGRVPLFCGIHFNIFQASQKTSLVYTASADYLARLYDTWKLLIRNLLGSSWVIRRHGSLQVLTISHISSVLKLPIRPCSRSMLESHCITHSHILLVTTFWSTVVSRP